MEDYFVWLPGKIIRHTLPGVKGATGGLVKNRRSAHFILIVFMYFDSLIRCVWFVFVLIHHKLSELIFISICTYVVLLLYNICFLTMHFVMFNCVNCENGF